LPECSRVATLNQVAEIWPAILGIRLEQHLVNTQRALDAGLAFSDAIILAVGILDEKCPYGRRFPR
jgi:hypothetical protein